MKKRIQLLVLVVLTLGACADPGGDSVFDGLCL
jgi:hypothetical protein